MVKKSRIIYLFLLLPALAVVATQSFTFEDIAWMVKMTTPTDSRTCKSYDTQTKTGANTILGTAVPSQWAYATGQICTVKFHAKYSKKAASHAVDIYTGANRTGSLLGNSTTTSISSATAAWYTFTVPNVTGGGGVYLTPRSTDGNAAVFTLVDVASGGYLYSNTVNVTTRHMGYEVWTMQ